MENVEMRYECIYCNDKKATQEEMEIHEVNVHGVTNEHTNLDIENEYDMVSIEPTNALELNLITSLSSDDDNESIYEPIFEPIDTVSFCFLH